MLHSPQRIEDSIVVMQDVCCEESAFKHKALMFASVRKGLKGEALMFAPSMKKNLIWLSFSSQSFLPSKTVRNTNKMLLWRVSFSNTKLLCSHLLSRTGLRGEALMLAPSMKKKLIWLSLSSQSHLRQWAVVMQRNTSKMSSMKSQLSNTKLLCSHPLWRTGRKGEALMFAPSMKNRLIRWSSYVRTFFEEEAYFSVFLIAVLPPI